MVELFQKKSLKRNGKPSFLHVLNRSFSKKEVHSNTSTAHHTQLGSDIKNPVFGSVIQGVDPYTPNLSPIHNRSLSTVKQLEKPHQRHSFTRNSERHQSSPELVTHHTNFLYHQQQKQQQQHYTNPQHYSTYSPASSKSHIIPSPTSPVKRSMTQHQRRKPVDPFASNGLSTPTPPLSPTNMSFATGKRSTWREMTHIPTYHPAPSISSAEDSEDEEAEQEEDDDDNEPLAHLSSPFSSNSTLYRRFPSFNSEGSTEESTELSTEDDDEEDDEDLVPIAALSLYRESGQHLSAAEKYKAKVKAKLELGSEDVAALHHEDLHEYPDQPQAVNPFL